MQENKDNNIGIINDNKYTFSNEDSWVVQCLSLSAIGALGYMQVASTMFG